MFSNSKFRGDTSNWKPYNLEYLDFAFVNCPAPVPYWATLTDKELRKKAIDAYHLNIELHGELINNNNNSKKQIKL
jgi:hypothetical protein